jgi:hypothetical protein
MSESLNANSLAGISASLATALLHIDSPMCLQITGIPFSVKRNPPSLEAEFLPHHKPGTSQRLFFLPG